MRPQKAIEVCADLNKLRRLCAELGPQRFRYERVRVRGDESTKWEIVEDDDSCYKGYPAFTGFDYCSLSKIEDLPRPPPPPPVNADDERTGAWGSAQQAESSRDSTEDDSISDEAGRKDGVRLTWRVKTSAKTKTTPTTTTEVSAQARDSGKEAWAKYGKTTKEKGTIYPTHGRPKDSPRGTTSVAAAKAASKWKAVTAAVAIASQATGADSADAMQCTQQELPFDWVRFVAVWFCVLVLLCL